MRSDKQIQASRTNGARSRGPITAQGKRNSSRNSARHGLLAQTVVLEKESAARFQKLRADLMDEYQPRTASQVALVETMAVTRWRQLRVWREQKTALERDLAALGPRLSRQTRKMLALPGAESFFCRQPVLLRYEAAFERQFNRARAHLLALQSLPTSGQTATKKIIPRNEPGQEIENKSRLLQIYAETKASQSRRTLPPGRLLTSGEAIVEIKG